MDGSAPASREIRRQRVVGASQLPTDPGDSRRWPAGPAALGKSPNRAKCVESPRQCGPRGGGGAGDGADVVGRYL